MTDVYVRAVQGELSLSYWLLQDVPSSSASKVSSVMVRHSAQPADNRDRIRQWIREQGMMK